MSKPPEECDPSLAALRPRIPRWELALITVAALILLPWTAYLTVTLPDRHEVNNWHVAWVGFDIALALSLALCVLTIVRRSSWLPAAAAISATLFMCDAWFDCVTANPGREFMTSLASALFAELPLAALCLLIAREGERSFDRATRYARALSGRSQEVSYEISPGSEPSGSRE